MTQQVLGGQRMKRRSASGLLLLPLFAAAVVCCQMAARWWAVEGSSSSNQANTALTFSAPGAMGGGHGSVASIADGASSLALARSTGRFLAPGPLGVSAGADGLRSATAAAALDPLREVAGVAAAAPPSGLEVTAQAVLGLAALYVIMSFNEYVYHRYFQHLGINKLDVSRMVRNSFGLQTYRGDGHVEHHRETLDDMSLTYTTQEILDADPYRGTAFPWLNTCWMILSVLVPAVPILSLFGWPAPVSATVATAAVLLHATTWNALHPNMHGLPDVPLSHGPPSALLAGYRDSALFRWLRENHEGHHRTEGAHGNYNVCCPLMDQVVGTYVGVIPPTEEAPPSPEMELVGAKVELTAVDA